MDLVLFLCVTEDLMSRHTRSFRSQWLWIMWMTVHSTAHVFVCVCVCVRECVCAHVSSVSTAQPRLGLCMVKAVYLIFLSQNYILPFTVWASEYKVGKESDPFFKPLLTSTRYSTVGFMVPVASGVVLQSLLVSTVSLLCWYGHGNMGTDDSPHPFLPPSLYPSPPGASQP